jgi:DNA-binding transcriptional regulator YiaG
MMKNAPHATLKLVETAANDALPAEPAPCVFSIRERTGLSQAAFARLLGVSVRTLQEWEQGRRIPSGAARTLLLVAHKNPQALRDMI